MVRALWPLIWLLDRVGLHSRSDDLEMWADRWEGRRG